MTIGDARVRGWIDQLRRDGSIQVHTTRLDGDVEGWRSAIRRAARRAGLRIRTDVTNDGAVVWVRYIDHIVTDAEMRAATRAMGSILGDEPIRSYEDLVKEERRKELRLLSSSQASDPEP